MKKDNRIRCDCGQVLAEEIDGMLLISHAGRQALVKGIEWIRCEKCKKSTRVFTEFRVGDTRIITEKV